MDNLAGIAQTLASVSAMGRATTVRQWTRVVAALAAGAVALTMMTACAPEPVTVPSPTPTGFASEQEAFAAAEATYRAYIDAVNARRENAHSTPDPTDFLTGSAYNDEIDTDRLIAERGWVLSGNTEVSSASGASFAADEVEMTFCLDASATRVLDANGTDVTPRDRTEVLGVRVVLRYIDTRLVISESSTSAEPC